MTYLSRTILILIALVVFSGLANAQSAVSAEKKAALTELLVVMKVEEQIKSSIDSVTELMNSIYPEILRNSLDKSGLPAKERNEMEKTLLEKHQSLSKKINDRFYQKVNIKQLVDELYYPVYDKFFTEAEIRDLIAFYKTPTGQKVIDTMPAMFDEVGKLSMEKINPIMIKIVNEITDEEVGSLGTSAPAKKKKN